MTFSTLYMNAILLHELSKVSLKSGQELIED